MEINQKQNSINKNKILIIAENVSDFVYLERLITNPNYSISRAKFNNDALALMVKTEFDLVIILSKSDYLLGKDSFIERMREYVHYYPSIVVLLEDIDSQRKRSVANAQGVDYCLMMAKDDYTLKSIKDTVATALESYEQRKSKNQNYYYLVQKDYIRPKFPGIGIAISTGGPKTIYDIFSNIPTDFIPPIFIVQHGPQWVLDDYVVKFKERFGLTAVIAKNNQFIQQNTIYIAPDGFNMVIDKSSFSLKLLDSEKECFVKPSADPLFRSIARIFGQYSVGVVMTGMGGDGSKGCMHIRSAGGMILVEDPKTAIAPSMPRTLIEIVPDYAMYNSKFIGKAIVEISNSIIRRLENNSTAK
jgi:two-component system chemotaxis response regulator CheB